MMRTKGFRRIFVTIAATIRAAWMCAVLGGGIMAVTACAQENQGPQKPPEAEHDVRRVTSTQPTTEAPPDTPQPLIIKHFSEKEEENVRVRGRYGYKKTI